MTIPKTVDVARLVQTHQRGLWRYLCLLGCEPALAEDLTQETFIAVLGGAFEERAPAATAAYLRTVARNLFLKSVRASKRRFAAESLDDVDAAWIAHADSGNDKHVNALKQCLGTLDERARMAVELRYHHEATGEEIAKALGVGEAAAKTVLHRARETLKQCVERRLKFEE